MQTTTDFTRLVNLCIAAAEERWGKLGPIRISYNLRGRAAGQACCRRTLQGEAYDLELRFNREALQKDWLHMVKETIPHEVAHLVGFAKPQLGAKNHNRQWQAIAQALGSRGERCHNIPLTSGRRRHRYRYVTDAGTEVIAGAKHHKLIQMHGRLAGIRVKSTRELVDRHHFKEAIAA